MEPLALISRTPSTVWTMEWGNSLACYLIVGALLFVLGMLAVLTRKNAIGILLGVELMLNAVGINFVAFSKYRTGNVEGQVATLFVILVAAAEAAVGLAIILRLYRLRQSVDADEATLLRD